MDESDSQSELCLSIAVMNGRPKVNAYNRQMNDVLRHSTLSLFCLYSDVWSVVFSFLSIGEIRPLLMSQRTISIVHFSLRFSSEPHHAVDFQRWHQTLIAFRNEYARYEDCSQQRQRSSKTELTMDSKMDSKMDEKSDENTISSDTLLRPCFLDAITRLRIAALKNVDTLGPDFQRLARSVQRLEFADDFDELISVNDLPSSLTAVSFGDKFCVPITSAALPANLRHLSFRFSTRLSSPTIHSCVPHQLPSSLTELHIGSVDPEKYSREEWHTFGELLLRNCPSTLRSLRAPSLRLDPDDLPFLSGFTHLQEWWLPAAFNVVNYSDYLLPLSSLHTLVFGYSFNRPLLRESLPVSLTSITTGACFNQLLSPHGLPLALKMFRMGYIFNRPLAVDSLPPDLEALFISRAFGQSLEPNFLPSSLKSLEWFSYRGEPPDTIKSSFHRSIALPFGLTRLRLSRFFDYSLYPNGVAVLPNTLRELYFGPPDNEEQFFNQPFPKGAKLPSSLTVLHFSHKFNQPISANVFPTCLTDLKFGENFSQRLPTNCLSRLTSLISLQFDGQYPHSLPALPYGLRFLSWRRCSFNVPTLPASLNCLVLQSGYPFPDTSLSQLKIFAESTPELERLTLESYFDRPFLSASWSRSLTCLDLAHSNYTPVLLKSSLPARLKSLTVHNYFQFGSDDEALPDGLTHLKLCGTANPTPKSFTLPFALPKTLQILECDSDDAIGVISTGQLYDCPIRKLSLMSNALTIMPSALPVTLRVLSFTGRKFNQPFDPNVLPPMLESLTLGDKYNYAFSKGILPLGLRKLYLGDDFNQPIQAGDIPIGLQQLILHTYFFNHPFGIGVLPDGLKYFRLRSSEFCHPFQPGSLPGSLQYFDMSVSSDYAHDLCTPGVLPPNLKSLVIPESYRLEIQFSLLPTSLSWIQVHVSSLISKEQVYQILERERANGRCIQLQLHVRP